MKIKFLKKLIVGVLTSVFMFNVYVSASESQYKIQDFPNLLNVNANLTEKPYGYYQVNDFTMFMDMGSWHGYGLPFRDDKDNLGSFAGPNILFEANSETIAINLSDAFSKLRLEKDGKPVDLSLGKPSIVYYPGKLTQSYEFKDFKVLLELIFVTDRTALVKTQIF